jgi:hypothetical protein
MGLGTLGLGQAGAPDAPSSTGAAHSSGVLKVAALVKIATLGAVLAGGAGLWLAHTPTAEHATVQRPTPNTAVAIVSTPTELLVPPGTSTANNAATSLDPHNDDNVAPSTAERAPPSAPSHASGASNSKRAPASEAELLQRAQALLARNPARALALADQHAKQFPQGQLAQEREVIRIEALRRLARSDEAEKIENDFDHDFPESAHRRKLDRTEP